MKNALFLLLPIALTLSLSSCKDPAEKVWDDEFFSSLSYAQDLVDQHTNYLIYKTEYFLKDESKAAYRPVWIAIDSTKQVILEGQEAIWVGLKSLQQPEADRDSPQFRERLVAVHAQLLQLYQGMLTDNQEALQLRPEEIKDLVASCKALFPAIRDLQSYQTWFQWPEEKQHQYLKMLQLQLQTLKAHLISEMARLVGGRAWGCHFGWNFPRFNPICRPAWNGNKLAQIDFIIGDWEDQFSGIHLTANGKQLHPQFSLSTIFDYPAATDSVEIEGYYRHFLTGEKQTFDKVTYAVE